MLYAKFKAIVLYAVNYKFWYQNTFYTTKIVQNKLPW